MACPICGANCKCKNRGPGGLCCGCHRHKGQRGYSRRAIDRWRVDHRLPPISDEQFTRQYEKPSLASLPFDGTEPGL